MQERARAACWRFGVARAWAAKNEDRVSPVAPSAPKARKRRRDSGVLRKSLQQGGVRCGMGSSRAMVGEPKLHRGGSGPNFVRLSHHCPKTAPILQRLSGSETVV